MKTKVKKGRNIFSANNLGANRLAGHFVPYLTSEPRQEGEAMNIRKNVDYSAMFAALDAAMQSGLQQIELYCELGRLVSNRPEKGAAVRRMWLFWKQS